MFSLFLKEHIFHFYLHYPNCNFEKTPILLGLIYGKNCFCCMPYFPFPFFDFADISTQLMACIFGLRISLCQCIPVICTSWLTWTDRKSFLTCLAKWRGTATPRTRSTTSLWPISRMTEAISPPVRLFETLTRSGKALAAAMAFLSRSGPSPHLFSFFSSLNGIKLTPEWYLRIKRKCYIC